MTANITPLMGMTYLDPHAHAEELHLLDAWRTRALDTVWRHASDWTHPATEAVVEAFVGGADPTEAVRRLGEARAAVGAGMSETIDDLMCLFRALGLPAEPELVREVAIGWATGAEIEPQTGCTDPVTGLRTRGYLVARMQELYDAPGGARPWDAHALLVLDVRLDGASTTTRFRAGALVGSVLLDVLGTGHPSAQLRPGLFAMLVDRATAPATVAALRTRVDHVTAERFTAFGQASQLRSPARTWIEQLPDDPTLCPSLVESLSL